MSTSAESDPAQTTPLGRDYDSAQFDHVVAAVHELQHPTQVGPYHIVQLIGEGGMGSVYKAEQRAPIHRTVAVKVIKLGMDTRQVMARFESERQALALMNHPNVARVLDAGATDAGRPYFVMEYVQGEPITQFADRHKLTMQQRLELFLQACDAVQHAHQKAIIHRDLKPSNILVMFQDAKPMVKVIDFGVAKAVSQRLTERSYFTETGQLVGTPEYMAPEQAEANALDIDTRSDVYSLGVVLYELLSGALPFDPKTLRSGGFNEIQRIIREVDPPRPSTKLSSLGKGASEVAKCRQMPLDSLARQLKGELEWIPLKAMRKDRAGRYATPTELAQDIRNYIEQQPLRAGPETTGYRLRKFLRRNRTSVTTAAVITAVVLIGSIVATVLAIKLKRAADAVRAEQSRTLEALQQVQQQKQQTEQANAVTTEVNRLMRDMLSAARPEISSGREITVREIVDQAARTLPSQLSTQPLVLAGVQHTLGNTNVSLGRLPQAIQYLRDTVAARRSALGEDDVQTLEAGADLADALRLNSQYDEAESVARPVLDRSRRTIGEQSRSAVKSQSVLSAVLMMRGDFEQAEQLMRKAFEASRTSLGDSNALTLSAASDLGGVLIERGKLAEAETPFRFAWEQSRRANGEDNPQTIELANNLASLLDKLGRSSEAMPMRIRNLEAQRKFLGPEHIATLTAMNNLAICYTELGDVPKAEALHREVYTTGQRVLGPEHSLTVSAMGGLGQLMHRQGRSAEAEPLLRAVLAARVKQNGPQSPGALAAMHNLAGALKAVGKLDESESLYRQCLDQTRLKFGESHANTLQTMTNLSLLLVLRDRAAEAEQIMRQAVDLSVKAYGPGHPNTLDARISLSDALLAQRKFDQSDQIMRQALQDSAALGRKHPLMLMAWFKLAKSVEAAGRPAEALELFRDVYNQLDRPRELQNTFADQITGGMLACWKAMGQFEPAEAFLLDFQRQLTSIESVRPTAVRRLNERFVKFYIDWNRPEQARVYQEKLATSNPATVPTSQPGS